jgi:hypothetical protein
MRLLWTRYGENFSREYHAMGERGWFVIDLDQPPVDRWFITVDGVRCVEDVYFIDRQDNAKAMVQEFEDTGVFRAPSWPYVRRDGRQPRVLRSRGAARPSLATSPTATEALHPVVCSTAMHDLEVLAGALVQVVSRLDLQPYRGEVDWLPWRSAVYALVDCIFSAQARYESTVLPMLKHRLQRRLPDSPALTFTEYLTDIDSMRGARFERYAASVLTRQVLSGRLKVEISYEAAEFLARRGFETMADLRAEPPQSLERLILHDLVPAIKGMGPTLGEYFLILLGDETRIKLDSRLVSFLQRELRYVPDPDTARRVLNTAAERLGTTGARLESAIWKWESGSTR